MILVELFDILCPNCERVITCLLPGETAGCHCSRCKVDFIAKIVGRAQVYQFGRGYRRCKPCNMIHQEEEPLLPKANGRYDKVEETAVTPGCPRDFRVEPIIPVPGMVIDG